MKKYILAACVAAISMSGFAQDFDVDPTLNISNEEKKVNFTVGARFMADAALFNARAISASNSSTAKTTRQT